VREGVEREVGSILRGGSWLGPGEGKAATRIPRAQDPVVRRVAVEGWSLHRGRESYGRRVDFRRGAQDPQTS